MKKNHETIKFGQWREHWARENAVSSPTLATVQHDFIDFSTEGAGNFYGQQISLDQHQPSLLIPTAMPRIWTQ